MPMRQNLPPRAPIVLLCLLGALTTGCGPGPERLVPVEGKVYLGSKVLAMDAKSLGTVILTPDASRGNKSLEEPRGAIDEKGQFKIVTGTRPGAALGWYQVSVNAAKVVDPKNPYHSASDFLMPLRYRDKTTSHLEVEVVEHAEPGKYDLKLEPD